MMEKPSLRYTVFDDAPGKPINVTEQTTVNT